MIKKMKPAEIITYVYVHYYATQLQYSEIRIFRSVNEKPLKTVLAATKQKNGKLLGDVSIVVEVGVCAQGHQCVQPK